MFTRMLVGIDASALSTRVVAAALDLALKSKSSVLVAHIRDVALPLAMAAGAGRPGGVAPMTAPPALEDEQMAQKLVQGAVQQFADAGVEAKGRVVGAGYGATAKELLQLAEEHRADVIVVGSHGSPVAQILLGSVAYRIVHQATCPVLVVR
jgi:universal stress protein A